MRMTLRKAEAAQEEAVDNEVIAQADIDSAWGKPTAVSRPKQASLKLPGDLAARAAFLARLHRSKSVHLWIESVVRERVELEENAFQALKRQLAR